jgi:hypothetical protein
VDGCLYYGSIEFQCGSDKKHEEENDQLSTEEGSYGYNTESFTSRWVLGSILMAR